MYSFGDVFCVARHKNNSTMIKADSQSSDVTNKMTSVIRLY